VIVSWNYTVTDPTRGLACACLSSQIGNLVQEATAVTRKVVGGARKNSTPLTATEIDAAKIKA